LITIEQKHKQKVQSHFDRWSQSYDSNHITGWLRYFQQRLIDVIDLEPTDHILDVGCGTGWAVILLSKIVTSGQACGIDLSDGMIEKARLNAAGIEGVEFRCADAEEIPYPDASFDYVICSSSFHHYPNPVISLKQFRRVLKPGGKSYILDTCRDGSFLVYLYDLGHKLFVGDHVRYYHSREISDFYMGAGFSKINVEFRVQKLFWKNKLLTSVFLISAQKKILT
jgi:ubiquinone/menaquinone biosynthesis C-methylase UbiE